MRPKESHRATTLASGSSVENEFSRLGSLIQAIKHRTQPLKAPRAPEEAVCNPSTRPIKASSSRRSRTIRAKARAPSHHSFPQTIEIAESQQPSGGHRSATREEVDPERRAQGSTPSFACPFYKYDPIRFASCHNAKYEKSDSVYRVSVMTAMYDREADKHQHHVPVHHKTFLTEVVRGRMGSVARCSDPRVRWKALYQAIFNIKNLEDVPSPSK